METDEVYNTFPGKDYNQMFTEVVSTLWLQASLLSSNPTPQYNGCHLNQLKPTSYHHLKKNTPNSRLMNCIQYSLDLGKIHHLYSKNASFMFLFITP